MEKIDVKIKRFDESLPLPAYQTIGAAGFDLYSRLDITIDPGLTTAIPLNVALELPPNYWLLLSARSSLHKRGLQPINGVGIIDQDYCGDKDEIKVLLHNYTSQAVTLKRGERIAQGVILPRLQANFQAVTMLKNADRGGFGTTGR